MATREKGGWMPGKNDLENTTTTGIEAAPKAQDKKKQYTLPKKERPQRGGAAGPQGRKGKDRKNEKKPVSPKDERGGDS